MREMVCFGGMDRLEWKGENLGKEVRYVPTYLAYLEDYFFFVGRWMVGW